MIVSHVYDERDRGEEEVIAQQILASSSFTATIMVQTIEQPVLGQIQLLRKPIRMKKIRYCIDPTANDVR